MSVRDDETTSGHSRVSVARIGTHSNMSAKKTGLLVLSNPTQLGNILSSVCREVRKTLYIQLLSALSEPFGAFCPAVFTSLPRFSRAVTNIYTQAAKECEHLDVRVLLSGLRTDIGKINTRYPIDLVIFDRAHNHSDIDDFVKHRISNVNDEFGVLTLDSGRFVEPVCDSCKDDATYRHTVLGGTFDRLHVAHKLLLSEAALRATERVTVGVTEESMLTGKTLWELIEPIDVRVDGVRNFLEDICPELKIDVVPIDDPYGPTQSDPTMELLVVSAETVGGGLKVNEVRRKNGLEPVRMQSVELLDEPHPDPNEESKISSSTGRMRVLGTLLRPVNSELPKKPYIIGITGGIASGKSGVAGRLRDLGAEVIDCDKIAHEVYLPSTPTFNAIVEEFGKTVVAENGTIDRRQLGGIVFKDREKLNKLNSLVWPAIADRVKETIKKSNADVVAVEGAVLIDAGWQSMCHEVWTTLVPRAEAILRLMKRNGLTEQDAAARVDSQKGNKFFVDNAHVVLCTLWPMDYTDRQVRRAWDLLKQRL